MRRVDVLLASLEVGPPLLIDTLVLLPDFHWEDGLPVDQFLGICRIIFREVHVNKASQGMSVRPDPDIPVLVCHPIDHLFLQTSLLVPFAGIVRLLGIDGVVVHDSVLLLSVEVLNCRLLLPFDHRLVIFIQLSDFPIIFFLELQVLLHHAVHVGRINIHVDHLLALLQCLVLVLES